MRRTRSACCPRAASGHATAVPPSSVMKLRRFNRSNGICCPSQVLRDSIPRWRGSSLAALRDFYLAHDRFGSFTTDQSGPSAARCPLLPQ